MIDSTMLYRQYGYGTNTGVVLQITQLPFEPKWNSGGVAPDKGGILAEFRPKSLGNTTKKQLRQLESKRRLMIPLDEFTERLAQPRELPQREEGPCKPELSLGKW